MRQSRPIPGLPGLITRMVEPGRPVSDRDKRNAILSEARSRYDTQLEPAASKPIPWNRRRSEDTEDVRQQTWIVVDRALQTGNHRFATGQDILAFAYSVASKK